MSKIHLIIADRDEAYVESIVNYIMNNYSQRFQVSSFTEEQYLLDYLLKNKKNIDILLICPQWYTDLIPREEVSTLIILSDGMMSKEVKNCPVINKYQKGNRLIGNIINCFAESNPDKYYIVNNEKKAKVVAVYSPLGGIGKTSVAVGLSVKSEERGKSIFYLNLENIQSTPSFFHCESSQNLSNILYYIKEKKKNISLKVEGIRCVDSRYNIRYFLPPDSIVDLNEATPNEIQYLIHELKISKDYDFIFIDMSSNMDEKNISILKASDQIILLLSQEDIGITKIESFMNELDIFSKRNNIDLSEKMTIVENKCKAKETLKKEIDLKGKSIEVKIPKVYEPFILCEDRHRKDMKAEFENAVEKLLEKINV
ncbi:MAG: AAA family ATPase [Clostridia bacterium]|nr:AAA family ATPase [Clostridia bacterium]